MSSTLVRSKVLRPTATAIEGLDLKVAEAYVDLEAHVNELRADMKSLQFYQAQEVEVVSGRKAVVVSIPVPQLKAYRKVSARLIRELEKKFSDKHVVFIARRKIIPKAKKGANVKTAQPRSRTLTLVHENMLEDIVYPTEIIGKRIRVKSDGSRVLKVLLNPKDRTTVEYKLDTFSSVYRKLTGKTVVFEFSTSTLE